MKIITTKKADYFRDKNGFYCFLNNGQITKCASLQGVKIKMSIEFKKFKPTKFKTIEKAIEWVRKRKICNTQLKDNFGNEWDNF
jgi:hypothetical protein